MLEFIQSITSVQVIAGCFVVLGFCFGWLAGEASGKRERNQALIQLVKTLACELIDSTNSLRDALTDRQQPIGTPDCSEIPKFLTAKERAADQVLGKYVSGYAAPKQENTAAIAAGVRKAQTRAGDRRGKDGKFQRRPK